ncbi:MULTISPECIES: stage V sporulation protein SpoVM [Flavonifractor]|uniref:Stage V sporulation protein SpoVM n=1 Tax=Candidatus Flavonifractor intestinigallinarum TaxID=2838586 RepID=A0A9D2MN92_9FIRM|nr:MULTISPECIES: stage V sporulation protein SpoVM [Flavonifractor]MBM6664073.1 stage V sporulation protein SpoVM [Flavonifractor plautii]MCI7472567.1 stage V sporulation protein SpoVM [Clostridiales bacterium]HIZ93616.1 stage V sporulation protein SpoVM [Candidatus Flavonifractor avicola]HJB81322.1 stage V sporulation protein SpoVM [Candidatus Flavonifractor intestinigallinarum]
MKIVVVKSPKALSSLLRLVFGIKKSDLAPESRS